MQREHSELEESQTIKLGQLAKYFVFSADIIAFDTDQCLSGMPLGARHMYFRGPGTCILGGPAHVFKGALGFPSLPT